ncbi:MAG: multicopper oxidase family protein [Candidatus Acidiferrum sp.]
MKASMMKTVKSNTRVLSVIWIVLASLCGASAGHASVPGIQGTTFNLVASENYTSQPDGMAIYSWGYGCATTTGVTAVPFGSCESMQIPGPTLIVTEGQTVTVTLTNNLGAVAGNTSIVFPGFQVCFGAITSGICGAPTSGNGVQGLLTQEAAPGQSVTYTFVATTPGTHAYYSGTQSDLQIEMGLYGALVVLPESPSTGCVKNGNSGSSYTLAASAYDGNTPNTCYDREYLFQLAEMDPRIHQEALAQMHCSSATSSTGCPAAINVAIEPYHARYFLINGRSMPDDMDANFSPNYPHQPYNGNPHMHPGDMVLLRIIGQGRYQHPLHEHGNHVRILARDGNLMVSQTDPTSLAGPLLFTTTTTPGVAMDGIFYWSGRGLNWDVYDHTPGDGSTCIADANGYNTMPSPPQGAGVPSNYYEWCADHLKPLETANGGPTTLPDSNILTNGLWFAGSAYLGLDATTKAAGPTPLPPASSPQNPNAGFAYMWHSHNEREITTNDVFPGGMMMMMIVDAPVTVIDETL